MNFNKDDPILILTPERTGTISLTHYLRGYNRGSIHNPFAPQFKPFVGPFITDSSKILYEAEDIVDIWNTNTPQLIITIVRDPIARVVSDVYHKLEQDELPPITIPPADYIMMMGCHQDAEYLMEYEVKLQTNLTIVGTDFMPPATVYTSGLVPLIVTRLEDFDILPEALRIIGLDVKGIVPRTNETTDYPEEDIKFPALYVERMLGTDYTKTFYSEEEIDTMRKRWTRD